MEVAEEMFFTSKGELPGFKIGAAWRFKKSSIDKWIEEQEKGIAKDKPN